MWGRRFATAFGVLICSYAVFFVSGTLRDWRSYLIFAVVGYLLWYEFFNKDKNKDS